MNQDLKPLFTRLMMEQWDSLTRFGLGLAKNEADADDLVSEAILKAFEGFSRLKNHSKFKSWLFSILHNQFVSNYRKKKSMGVELSISENGDDSFSLFEAIAMSDFVDASSPEKEFIRSLNSQSIEQAINELPDDFRTALTLCDMEELSYREIAEVINVPIGTVRSRIARARAILQDKLWELAQELGIRNAKEPKRKTEYTCDCGKEELDAVATKMST